jgi:hypothetical protein
MVSGILTEDTVQSCQSVTCQYICFSEKYAEDDY